MRESNLALRAAHLNEDKGIRLRWLTMNYASSPSCPSLFTAKHIISYVYTLQSRIKHESLLEQEAKM